MSSHSVHYESGEYVVREDAGGICASKHKTREAADRSAGILDEIDGLETELEPYMTRVREIQEKVAKLEEEWKALT